METIKQDHFLVLQIPTRQHLLSYPLARLSPQKAAVETIKNEKTGMHPPYMDAINGIK